MQLVPETPATEIRACRQRRRRACCTPSATSSSARTTPPRRRAPLQRLKPPLQQSSRHTHPHARCLPGRVWGCAWCTAWGGRLRWVPTRDVDSLGQPPPQTADACLAQYLMLGSDQALPLGAYLAPLACLMLVCPLVAARLARVATLVRARPWLGRDPQRPQLLCTDAAGAAPCSDPGLQLILCAFRGLSHAGSTGCSRDGCWAWGARFRRDGSAQRQRQPWRRGGL